MVDTQKVYAAETDEAHPDVFTKMPPQPVVKKPGQLSEERVKEYFEKGFLVVKDFFDKETELDPIKKEINDGVDAVARRLYETGKIKDLHKDKGFSERLTALEVDFPGTNVLLHKYGQQTEAIWNLWTNERILNLVEQLLGTADIQGHPVWNLRTKTPGSQATTVPWHQDIGYLDNDAYSVHQPTLWIPFVDATRKNGCMEMVSEGHRTGRVAKHTGVWRNTWYVMLDEAEMEKTLEVNVKKDSVCCEVPYGGFVLFNNLIPHRSLNNESNEIRWSLDFRWQKAGLPVGFHGLRHGVVMRKSEDPSFKPDFNSEERRACVNKRSIQEEEEFSATMGGPWMKRWELVHTNRHTEAERLKSTW